VGELQLNRGWTDERIEALSHQSVWTFRYFRHGNTSTTPDAEQHLLTISRAPSVRELRQIPFAAFDTRTVTWLRSGLIPPPPSPSLHLFWMGAAAGGTPPPVQCEASSPSLYSANTMFTDFELWGRSLRLVEHSHSYATYIPHTRATATPPSRPLNAVGP